MPSLLLSLLVFLFSRPSRAFYPQEEIMRERRGKLDAFTDGSLFAGENTTTAERNKYALRSGPLDLPYSPRRGYADGPYGQVHFRDTEHSNGGLPLILCHMSPRTSKQFSAVYELFLQHGIRAICADTPGFGESDPTPFVPTVEDWAAAIVAVLDHLRIDKANFVGHHTGAKLAMEVALQFPERVGKLILQGPTLLSEEERLKALQYVQSKEIDAVFQTDGSHLLASFQYLTQAWNHAEPDNADPSLFTRYCSEKYQGYAPFWTGHHAAFIYDDGDALKRIQHETMILSNTGDVTIHNQVKEAHAKLRPDLVYKELEGGTGDVVDQMPEEWVDAVVAFLNDCRGAEDGDEGKT